MLRRLLSCALLVCFAMPSRAQDLGAGMLYVKGTAWVNGTSVPDSIAVFPGDEIQTNARSAANINAEGSTVLIAPESLAKYEKGAIELQHGGVSIGTYKQLPVHVKRVKITPTDLTFTQYQVDDIDGRVHVYALKGNVMVDYDCDRTRVEEGKNITVDENGCAAKTPKQAAVRTNTLPGMLNSPWAMRTGIAVVGGITTWVLLPKDDPASTWSPRRSN